MNIEIAPKETEIHDIWDNAKLYCLFLKVDGNDGWRLPTKGELDYIYKSKNDFVCACYWSAADYVSFNTAYIQSFLTGQQYRQYKTNSFYVRAVRDL